MSSTIVVHNGESIQAAITAAAPGDTIVIEAGVYTGNVTINKQLTIQGAHSGVDGSDANRDLTGGVGESTLSGLLHIGGAGNGVVVDGLRILNGAHTGATGSDTPGIFVQSSDVVITNSVFFRDGTVDSDQSRGIMTSSGANGLLVTDNVMTGWHTGVYVNGGQTIEGVTVTDNTFEGNLVGLSMDAFPSGQPITVTDNEFTDNLLEGIGVGSGAGGATWNAASVVSGNTFDGPGIFIWGPAQPAIFGGNSFIVNAGDSIQAAIDAAAAGDTVFVANGDYTGNLTLKSGVNVLGESQAGVVIHGTVVTPGSFDNATVSNLTVQNVGDTMLLDMRATHDITDSVFDHVTFSLSGDFTGAVPIGNGQISGSIALHDGGDADQAGLTFRHVTMASNNHLAGATAFVYTTTDSIGGAKMVLDDVTLTGTASGTASGLGAQWNMTNGAGSASVDIVNSHTSAGGNFYVSGFDGVTIQGNVFDGQGLALNGVTNAEVTGNTFQNIDDTYTANGTQHRGLVIEDAWGTDGVADLTVTGNTFQNIDAADGAIAFQRFTGGSPADTATIARLNDIDIHGNTFTDLGPGVNPVYLNPTDFGAGAVLPANFDDANLLIGTSGNDNLVDASAGAGAIFADAGNDSITGGAGSDTLTGGGGTDTATGYSASATISIDNTGHWVVTDGASVDTLTGVEKVVIGGKTYLLVDQQGANAGGYQHVQDAINAASGGETILIAPGTYTESGSDGIGHTVGLYINKPNLTLQGVDDNGALITASAAAATAGATIISGHQTGFGANHWVDVNGDGTTIQGLRLQAGPETNNKVLEIWGDNVTVENSFIDTRVGGTVETGAIAVYVNDNGTTSSEISSYAITGNALNGTIIIANGVGDPSAHDFGGTQLITNNHFQGTFDYTTGVGRYTDIVINGKSAGTAWLLAPTQIPTITGNTFEGNTTPILLRGLDDDPANFPTVSQVDQILATNGDNNLTYAYVIDPDGHLRTDNPDFGAGVTHRFIVANSIDTLNLALDTTTSGSLGTTDHVFPDQRLYIHDGDTVVVQSGATGAVNSAIMVDNLTVKATAHSTDLNLTLATQFADGTPIANGGVHNVTLADYAQGQGANVDVTGNGLDNVITGNSGANTLDGGAGNDTLTGGGGADTLIGGGGTDTASYSGALTAANITAVADTDFATAGDQAGWQVAASGEGVDLLTGIEKIDGAGSANILLVGNGGYATIQEAVDAAVAGDTIVVAAGVFAGATISKELTIIGQGVGQTIITSGPGQSGFQFTGDIDATGSDSQATVTIAGFTFTGNAVGVRVASNAVLDHLVIQDSRFAGNTTHGIGTGSGAFGLDAIDIVDSTFEQNGNGSQNGDGDIVLFGFTGDALIKNVTIAGGANATPNSSNADTGIQINGREPSSYDVTEPIGNVVFDNVTVTGSYAKVLVYIQGYTDLDGLTFLDTGTTIDGSAGWGWALAIDPMADETSAAPPGVPGEPGFFDDAAAAALAPNTVDLSHVTVTNDNPINVQLGHPLFAFNGMALGAVYAGTPVADNVTGTDGIDVIAGRGGNDIIHAGGGDDAIVYAVGDGLDTINGGAGTDTLFVNGTAGSDSIDVVVNGAGVVTSIEGMSPTAVEHFAVNGGAGADTLSYAGTTGAVNVNLGTGSATGLASVTGVENVTGGGGADTLTGDANANTLTGGAGNDTLNGGAGADAMIGGVGNDIYVVDDAGDVVTEAAGVGAGIDTVRSSVTYTLAANVENLTLTDGDFRTETFENFVPGPIADGENGWKYAGTSDQEIVEVGGDKMLRMSSDPTTGAFGGPYSPALGDAAGEPQTTADFSAQAVRFTFRAVDPDGDNSRLEVDFGNAAGTDRNNFMVIESVAGQGIRIAVNEPTTTNDVWTTGQNFTAFTGNVELISGRDASQSHEIELRLTYVDGPNNDVINVYLDGQLIGTTTTFENYRDWFAGPTHADSAEANQTNRVFFRNSAGGAAPQDGPGGQNQGFYFDNLTYGVYNNAGGTGNELNNVITGNSGDNLLAGAGGDDTLIGGAGADTLDGGAGIDTAVYAGTLAAASVTFNTVSGLWEVNGDASEGADTLSNTEIVQHAGGRYLLVDDPNTSGANGFADAAAAALVATQAGDTILFAVAPTPTDPPIEIDLSDDDEDIDLTIPGDADLDIETGDGDNKIVTGDGDNKIVTGDGDNDITTGDGDDIVITGGGDDTIHTGDGDDVVHAGGGDDEIVGGQGGGNDLYDGGSGSNTVEYPSANTGITVDLNEIDRSGDPILGAALGAILLGASLPATTPVGYAQGADIGIDALIDIDNVLGGHGNDSIAGDSDANIFTGGAGDDTLIGRGGIDTAHYTGTLVPANITAVIDVDPATAGNQAGWQVSAGAEGTDLLTGIEKVTDSAGNTFLLVGSGGFATLALANAAAQAGDTTLVGPTALPKGDFNGDSASDFLWQHDSGLAAVWLIDDTSLASGALVGPSVGPSWHLKGSGDFNADGGSDFLWQNDNGQAGVWLMNGTNLAGGGVVGPAVDPSWHVKGAGDFDGDSFSDILWQNDNGQAGVWLMNGTNLVGGGVVGPAVDPSWHIKAAGDFNGDSFSDILWQNDNGQAGVWLMNGTNLVGGGVVGPAVDPSWHVKAAGDFNDDSFSDILWQNDNGQAAVWLMNGTNLIGGGTVGPNPGADWSVVGTGQFNNGDANSDILWQHDNGQAAVWLMDGTTLLSGEIVASSPGPDWHLIG